MGEELNLEKKVIMLKYPTQILDQDTYQIDLLLERSTARWAPGWQLPAGRVLLPPLPGNQVERLNSLPLTVHMAGYAA